MDGGKNENRISYHEYKRRLKKLTEEIKKEKKKKTINKNKNNENLTKLEEELSKLNAMYNLGNADEGSEINNSEKRKDHDGEENTREDIADGVTTTELYSYNAVSKKALRNIKRTQRKEMEIERIEQSRSKVGELEYDELVECLKEVNKTIHPIAPDGNCLYESILHQLRQRVTGCKYHEEDFLNILREERFSLDNINLRDYQNGGLFDFSIFSDFDPQGLSSDILRFLASVYILQNEEQFIHFVYATEEDEPTADTYFGYCEAIIKGCYGSEIEINALSKILKKKITVYDVNIKISYGEEHETELFICFHHKLYALGKHYNSVVDI
ncbi:conserved Plasmodium protein, unknown function [Plasmodium knowlesi strain H]|uniref:OTU domain-containing protein n=3 Tax=Plasmodium knowlesi TaxID=5850 RepID=A0A5K1VPA6_PLAKH|nr:OTU domain-containing protein, putative [Plasmodium knowlesi strain H]OTN65233.1 Uncharacterized protein PKNOH_S120158200 [Plasmodium knowlesi]CAA9988438.1 OTU domain-containing protein, putative [Plasmodium knowlesi strain H]SBO19863.1 conserved Plasmodium protein, unknown function [Plasmodium knowlesi strain H]SBO20426.1 conserved Plasmodium protein, unknown function [Plasmodium knowlesi strain H]VVS77912.1 OTU domain-containing protein, putative [Plasmodium knowlesi strain H]|eukprot:XP_002259419.1 hypothetical protein, conserved in Plasmodium species [Plasmodium knowlesi strain H]